MIKIDIYHERLDIIFYSSIPREISEYVLAAKSAGLTYQEDLFVLNRKGNIPPWQHQSIVECSTFLKGKEIFGKRGKWDRIVFSFLFASLPESCWNEFNVVVFKFSDAINIKPKFNDKYINFNELSDVFIAFKQELINKFNLSPGSEELAIIINSSYQN